MFKVSRRYLRRIAPVALAFALISALAPASAEAAALTSVSVTPTDPTAAATDTTWTIGVGGGITASTAKCVKISVAAAADFSGSLPAGFAWDSGAASSIGGAGQFVTGAWTEGTASGIYQTFTQVAGVTPTAANIVLTHVHNPTAAVTSYVKVETFTDVGCSTAIDSGTSAVATTTNTTVSVIVDPTFTFSVTGRGTTACNGITATLDNSGGAGATSVNFGHLAAGNRLMAGQTLTVTTNAGGGYVINLHSTSASANVMKGSGSHVITDATSAALPAAGNEFFGYNSDKTSGGAMTSGNLKPVPINSGNDVVGNGSAGTGVTNCVTYAVGASASTPADTYVSTMVYTAIPTF